MEVREAVVKVSTTGRAGGQSVSPARAAAASAKVTVLNPASCR